MGFDNRSAAGRALAARIPWSDGDVLVLGLARGGVVVAAEVARALHAELDVWVARKLGAPDQPEVGMGALSEGGTLVLDRRIIELVGATDREIDRITRRELVELERRVRLFRGGRPAPRITGREVVLVDDGIATGGTVRAALRAIHAQGPRRIVLAVPVAPSDTLRSLATECDDIVCLESLGASRSVGGSYADFTQVPDSEVVELLESARTDASTHA